MGVENLLAAFEQLIGMDGLVIAGEVQKGHEKYMAGLKQTVTGQLERGQITLRTEFIPDAEVELLLKAASVLVLPYYEIFQSGVLFMGYAFGLPLITTDVGSFRAEIAEGRTGYLCRPGDPADLARTIEAYFASDLYRDLGTTRQDIKKYAEVHHSGSAAAESTRDVYMDLMRRTQA